MNDNLEVGISIKDEASPTLKAFESTVIRTVGAVSAALAAISAIAFPITSAVEFQKNMLDVKKTTDLSYDSIQQLGRGLIELSTHTNKSANDLAKMAEMGGRMGVAEQGTTALLEFVKQVSTLSTALNLSAEETATGMGKLFNIFNLSMSEYQRAGAVINRLDNASTATAEQLFEIMRRMGNLGGAVNLQQSAALAALAVDLGMTAETAGTTYTKIFANMKAKASEFASFMGITTEQWVESVNKDGVQALRKFLEQLNRMPTEVAASTKIALAGGGRIFEFVTKLQEQIRRGPNSLLDKQMKEGSDAWREGDSAIKGQQSILSGLAAQWDIFKNKVNAVALAMGEKALYGLTQALTVLGDQLSKPENIEAFVKTMNDMVDAVTSLLSALSKLTSGIDVPWTDILKIGAMMAGIKALGMLRSAMLALPTKVTTAIGWTQPTAPKGGSGTENLQKEQTLLGTLRTAYAERVAQQASLNILKEADLKAEQELAAATAAHATAQARLSAARSIQSMAVAGAEAVASVPSSATAYMLAREEAQNQQRLALEREYQAKKAAITGRGSVARKAELAAEYDTELAALEKKLAAQMRGYQLHYRNLAALEAQNATRAAAGVGQTTSNVTLAERRVAGTASILADKSAMRMDTKAALDAAEEEIAKSKIPARLTRIKQAFSEVFSGKDVNGEASKNPVSMALQDMIGRSERWNEAAGRMGKVTVSMGGAFTLLGQGVAAAASGIRTVVSVGMRFLGWVGVAVVIYDIGKALLEMTGLLDPLIKKANSLIDTFNKVTGLKAPKFSTAEDTAAAEAAARENVKRIEDAAVAASSFSKKYGSVKYTVDTAEAAQQIDSVRQNLEDVRKTTEKGVKLDIFKDTNPTQAMSDALQTLTRITKEQEYLNQLISRETGEHVGNGTALAAKERELQRLQEIQAKIAAESASIRSTPTSSSQVADTTRDTRLSNNTDALTANAKKIADIQAEINILREKEATSATKTANMQAEQVMLATSYENILTTTLSGLNASALSELWGNGDEMKSRIAEAQRLGGAYEILRKKQEELKSSADTASAGRNAEAAAAAGAAYEKATQDALAAEVAFNDATTAIANTRTVMEATNTADRAMFVQSLVNAGSFRKQMEVINQLIEKNNGNVGAIFTGKAAMSVSAPNAKQQFMGQLLFAQSAKAAYAQLASTAASAAETAKTAVSKAIEKTKQDLDSLREAAVASSNTLRQNMNAAAANKAGKAIDAGTSKRILELDLEKQKELDILEVMRQQGSISDQNYARRRLDIEQAYAPKYDAVNDAGSDAKTKFAAAQQVKLFEEQKAKAIELQTALDGIAAKMRDTSLPAEEKAKLATQFHGAITEVEAYIKAMATAKSSIESMALSGSGKAPVSDTVLESMRKDITNQTAKKNTANQGVASEAQQVADNMKTSVAATEASIRALEKSAVEGLRTIAATGNETFSGMAQQLAALAQTDVFTKIKEGFRTAEAEGGLGNLTLTLNEKEFSAQVDSARKSAVETFNGIPIIADVTKVDAALKASIDKFYSALSGSAEEGSAAKKVSVKIDIDKDTAMTALKETFANSTASTTLVPVGNNKEIIEKALAAANLTAPLTLIANGVTGMKDGGKLGAYAGGGPIGRDITAGGPIRGAGSGTSDSILFWGAHGEYMMDALTTRTFGADFFATLQLIAKSGSPASLLYDMLPKFKGGGAVGKVAASLPAVLGSSTVDGGVSHLSLTINGRAIGKVAGSRDTLNSLVSALQEVARAT